MRRRAAWAWMAVALVIVGMLAVSARTLLAWALPSVLGLALHGNAHIAHVEIGGGRILLHDVRITKHGDPLLDVRTIRVDYSLRDLLPGSSHRFGLLAVDIDRPVFTFERYADGSYNLALGGGAPAPTPPGPLWLNAVPINFTLRVHDGTIALRAPHALDLQSRSIDVHDLQLDATVNTATRTHYQLTGSIAASPFTVRGTVDATRGYAMHRVQVAALNIRPIANFFINSKAAKVLAGTARGIDMRIYALGVEPEAPVDYHLSGRASIDDASMNLVGLGQPVRNLRGTLQVVDDQLFFNDLRGQAAGLTMTGVGSIFDLPAAPQFRIGISGRGDIATLRTLFPFAQDQPLAGPARIGVAVDGGLDDPAGPRVQATVDSPHASYHGIVFDNLRAHVAYYNSTVFFMPIEAHAQGSTFTMRGVLEIGDKTVSRVALHIDAPADALPYAGALLGSEPLTGDFLLHGTDLNFYGYGALQSARGISRMAAVVHADHGGVLDVAPLWIDTERGRLYAGYHLDRTRDQSSFWINAQHLVLRTPARTSFLAGAMAPMPPLDGTIDSAAIRGGGPSGVHTLVAGRVGLRATIAGVRLDRVRASFAGTLADAALDPVNATGPWGTFNGRGALSLSSFAVHGHYAGTFAGLRQFLSGVPASGAIDGTAALALGSQGIIVQADNIRMRNASIHGLPISAATGTLAIRNGGLIVKSVRATVASGAIVAAGSFGDGIALVATNLKAAQLRALGLPLDAGTVDAEGTLAQGAPLPSFNGGVALANGRVQHFAVAGSSLVALRGDGVQLDHTVGGMENVYAIASGSLTGLTSGAPAYDMHADVPAGDLTKVVTSLGIQAHYAEGTFNADIALRGTGAHPTVSGPVGLPAGSVNGLYFTDVSGDIGANPSGVAVQDGAVTVASTRLAFNAIENAHVSALQVRTNYANLGDFNNFFDTGDTLSGTGPVRFDIVSDADRLSSNGAINIEHLRYRTLPIGTTAASWSSARSVLHGSLNVSGAQGTLHSHGSIGVRRASTLFNTLRDSNYDLTAQLSDVDLSTWIAALGAPQVGITGRVNANATVNGRWPNPRFNGSAELDNGTIYQFPIDKASMAVSTHGQRVSLDSANITAPGISAAAYGSMGFSMEQPLQFTLLASSNDVQRLAAEFSREQLPITGSFTAALMLGGTPANPTVNATLDGTNAVLYGVNVPSLHGSVALERHSAVLHDASITLPKGSLAITGSVPVQVNPLALGPPKAPLSFNVTAKDIDPSAFDTFLGNNTKLGGTIDGDLAVSGTVAEPQISGRIGIANGTFVSDFDRTPITGIQGAITFDRESATLDNLHANFGDGKIAANGNVVFPQAGKNMTYLVTANARGAQFNLPSFGAGTVDGELALTQGEDGPPLMSGRVEFSNATIPFAAFLAASPGTGGAPPPLDLNVDFVVGRNVRVRGSGFGAGLDVAGTGEALLSGTLARPTMAGTFSATSGTLTFFDRAFRVQTAHVTFRPEDGIVPTIRATGTTRVTNPDPNSAFSGIDVTVAVEGRVTSPRVTFSSNPPGYSNEQILAMIAPFGGVILPGLSYAPTTNGYGTTPGAVTGSTGTFSASQEAFNIVNAQFAAGLLSPLEGALSQGLGVQNVNLTLDYWGNVGISASRLLGRTVNFIYAATFGIPQRTSFGLQLVGEHSTSAQLVFFYENGPQRLFQVPYTGISSDRISLGQALQGQQGFAFTFQRLFW